MAKPATPGTPAASASRRVVGRRLAVWGWAFIALSVAISGVWTYSGWYSIDLWSRDTPTSEFELGIWSGAVRASESAPWDRTNGQVMIGPREPEWHMDWTVFRSGTYQYRGTPLTRYVRVGLWPLIAVSVCAGWLLLRLARRAHERLADDQCHRCGYAMVKQQTGEHAGTFVCPECGPQAGVRPARRAARTPRKRGPVWVASGWLIVGVAVLVATVWAASRWWELRVTQLPWVVTVAGGAVLIHESHPDDGEVNEWVWSATPAEERTIAWRSNLDGYPNGPAVWSYDYRDTGYWHHMVVLWPVWAGAGWIGGWMVWSWRRGRVR